MSESVWLDADILDELDFPQWILNSAQRRRLKATVVLLLVWITVSAMHLMPISGLAMTGLATVIAAAHAVRFSVSVPPPLPAALEVPEQDTALEVTKSVVLPRVSILVPAKNESQVLPHLLSSFAHLDYPATHTELWVIDDGSTDQTLEILTRYQEKLSHLHIYPRLPGAGGGKSGALNEVLPHTQGDIVLVCDADATVPSDFLRRTLPLFFTADPGARPVGAVQVRKAIANAKDNFWTRGQEAEMALDSYFQQQRTAIHGLGELRGNGQLVRRDVLQKCGGWNESTLTDDLDLSFKLHLAGVDILFVSDPAIYEEGVTTWRSLWHQRSRWAEGGYQRYLDYWPAILKNGMGFSKTIDLVLFFLVQYLIPMALVPDFLWGIFYSHRSVLWPLTLLMSGMSITAFWGGLRQIHHLRGWQLLLRTGHGLLYMLHWIPVMIATTTRLCIQPKRLKWVKTEHRGVDHAQV
jgi:1,2-diacylglycerol 3-beta-glucosyltransferase